MNTPSDEQSVKEAQAPARDRQKSRDGGEAAYSVPPALPISQPSELFDVIATEIATGKTRVIASGVSARNAEAIVEMAVIRRGVETEFYAPVPRQDPRANQETP